MVKGPNIKITPEERERVVMIRMSGALHAKLTKVARAIRMSNNKFITNHIAAAVQDLELKLFPTKEDTDVSD